MLTAVTVLYNRHYSHNITKNLKYKNVGVFKSNY